MTYDPDHPLTERQKQVLVAVAKGETYKAIAQDLGNHEQTIKTICESLRLRYDTQSQAQTVVAALKKHELMLDDL